MAEPFELKVLGLEDLKAALLGLSPKLRKRAIRNSLAAGARIVRDAAKQSAPVLRRASKYRTVGLLKKSISVRTSKRDARSGDVGVYVNVKPAKSGQRGAKSANDPFYWRFVNFGTKRTAPVPFLTNAASRLPDALRKFEATLGPQIDKLNRP